jgi:hypothetical protein
MLVVEQEFRRRGRLRSTIIKGLRSHSRGRLCQMVYTNFKVALALWCSGADSSALRKPDTKHITSTPAARPQDRTSRNTRA